MMLAAVAFLAGVITAFTPCVFFVLPVILGTALSGGRASTPYVVVLSLALSIILSTLLLKTSEALMGIPPSVWSFVSGGILLLLGTMLFFPGLRLLPSWGGIGERMLERGVSRGSHVGDIIVGASLGPIFSSCSPTYFLILATVFPLSYAEGLFYVTLYTFGLALVLLLVALLGTHGAEKLSWFSNPHGAPMRGVGALFIGIGILIITGMSHRIETFLVREMPEYVFSLEYYLIDSIPE
jgi:cytochrome c-type biogenesis protein